MPWHNQSLLPKRVFTCTLDYAYQMLVTSCRQLSSIILGCTRSFGAICHLATTTKAFLFFAVVPTLEGGGASRSFSVVVAHAQVKFGFIGKLDGLKRFGLWAIWSVAGVQAFSDDGFVGGTSCNTSCQHITQAIAQAVRRPCR